MIDEIEGWTEIVLLKTGGTGKVMVEFDFKDWNCQGVRAGCQGGIITLRRRG